MNASAQKDAISYEMKQNRALMRGLSEKTTSYQRLKAKNEALGQKLSELKKQQTNEND